MRGAGVRVDGRASAEMVESACLCKLMSSRWSARVSPPASSLPVLARRVAARLPLGCDRLASPLSAPVAASTLVRQLQWMLCLRLPAAEARPSNMSWLSSSSLHLMIWQLALLD